MIEKIKQDNIEKQNDTPINDGERKNTKEIFKNKSNITEETEKKDDKIIPSIEKTDTNKEKVLVENIKISDKKNENKRPEKLRTRNRPDFKKNFRKRNNFLREKSEFEQKILSLRRVTRVMAGGRRFSFSVAIVVGDKKERVGLGLGKSSDTTLAIEKAVSNAKKNMVKIILTKEGNIKHNVSGKYKSSEVIIRPVAGKGLAAGGSVRTVLEFAGVKEAGAKILSRSKNHINNAKATLIALSPFLTKIEVSLKSTDRNKRIFKPRIFGVKKTFIKKNVQPFQKIEEQKVYIGTNSTK